MQLSYPIKRNSEGGQGLVEYSIILALLALAVIAVLVVIGPGVGNIFSETSNAFNKDSEEPSVEPAVEPVDVITIAAAE